GLSGRWWAIGRIVLTFEDIMDRCLKARLVVQPAFATALRPPFFACLSASWITGLFTLLQPAGTTRFQMVQYSLRFHLRRRHHDMHVLTAAVDGMQVPAANRTMVRNCLLHQATLLHVQG